MKKLLIILIFQMMIFGMFSQNITKDSVTTSKLTFKLIVKDLRKYDSLKVAYQLQSKTLDTLIADNTMMFQNFEELRAQKQAIQMQLTNKETELKKLFQKPNTGWLVPVLVGVLGGVVLGVSL
ncbi:hypothetical protein [Bizionia sp.]|uniref:hypothetical protein n=1 Tax=Bizionia sp. TaxID=1954480 RepID=UPI003A92FA40